MTMYLAELHGKFSIAEERREDILTSNVFSFFKYAKREIFLKSFLNLLGLQLEPHELDEVEFIFWPTYQDQTEPDLVILVGRYYLLIEAKLFSGFGKALDFSAYQLSREIAEGKLEAHNLEKEFRLIAVTAHYAKHQFIAENPEFSLSDITWINWHQIAMILDDILNTNEKLDSETKSFALDLYSLLVKKNLRKFAGQDVFNRLASLKPTSAALFFNAKTAKYRGDFLGFHQSLEEFSRLLSYKYLFFDKRDRRYFTNLPILKFEITPNHIFFQR